MSAHISTTSARHYRTDDEDPVDWITTMSVSQIEVVLIGTPSINAQDRHLIRLERKASALLFLAVRRPTTSRAAAAALLWPHVSSSAARTNLRVTTHRLHRAVGRRLFEDSDVLELVGCEDDISRWLHRTLTPAVAIEMLSKPLLDGFQFDDCPDMSVLIEQTQNALYDHAEREIHRHGQILITAEEVQAPDLTLLFEALALRPLAERVAADLMELLLRLGDRAAALAIYERLRSSMRQELGVSPSPETQGLHTRVLQAVTSDRRRTDKSLIRSEDRSEFSLVERESMLERLWESAARGQHVLIEGEAGIGKSRLIREFARAYRKVCFVRLKRGNEQQSYSLLRQLMFQLRDVLHLTQYPPVLRYFARNSVDKARSPDSLGGVDEIGSALLDCLIVARQAGLEILVIDDCHEIDAFSTAVLISLFDKLEQPGRDVGHEIPSLVFAGRGDAPNSFSTRLLSSCHEGECCSYMQLEPITAEGVAQMIDKRGLTNTQIGLTYQELQRRTGGNPFFVAELLREASWGRPLTLQWLPSAVSALFRERISTLSDESFYLLEIAYCAGSDFEPAMFEDMREWQPGVLLQAWTELRRKGLFGSTGFAHDLARAATEAELSGPARRDLHRKIAKFLETHSLPERIAHHLILGGRSSDALPYAVAAARRLVSEYSFQEALALLKRALQKGIQNESQHVRSARFAATCLMAHCVTLLNGPSSQVRGIAATLPELATSATEKLIAECWITQALAEDPTSAGAAAVVKRDFLPDDDSVWSWSLRIIHCNAWIALRNLDQAAAILPRLPTKSDEECWDFGLHSFGQYTYCLIGLGLLNQAETFTSSYDLPARTSYLKYALRASIAEERGDLHSAAYWKRELLAGFAQSRQEVPAHLVSLTTLRLAMCELRRGQTSEARQILQSIAEGGSEANRNDTLLGQAIVADTEDDDVGYRRARRDTRLDGDPDVYLHIYWIEVCRALQSGDLLRAENTYVEGLQRIRELNFLSCSAYRLLGGRFDEPQVAIAMAEAVLKSTFNKERTGLLALAQLEIARASLRIENISRAERALLEMHALPFLGFAYILLPEEFLHSTAEVVKQCSLNSLSEFAERLQALIKSMQDSRDRAARVQQASMDQPLARA